MEWSIGRVRGEIVEWLRIGSVGKSEFCVLGKIGFMGDIRSVIIIVVGSRYISL